MKSLFLLLLFATATAAAEPEIVHPSVWIRGPRLRGMAFAPSDLGEAWRLLRVVCGGPNISHSSSEVFMAETGFVSPPSLRGKVSLLRSRTCSAPLMTQTIQRSNSNPIVDFLKRSLIAIERTLVTITSGTELAEAQAIMEENRLFGSRRLHKLREHVKDRLGLNEDEHETSSMGDFYSAGPYSFSSHDTDPGHPVAIRRQHAAPFSSPLSHEVQTASMDDCYSPWGDLSSSAELSGGFNEGAGDDLPILEHYHAVKTDADKRYTAAALNSKFAGSAFKDDESLI